MLRAGFLALKIHAQIQAWPATAVATECPKERDL